MFYPVSRLEFTFALTKARETNHHVKESVTHPTELAENARWFLSSDDKTGFGITYADSVGNCELIGVFSTVKGRGPNLVRTAVLNGANVLCCFDGFLVSFYQTLGFSEYDRAPNWNYGKPDVVFLEFTGASNV